MSFKIGWSHIINIHHMDLDIFLLLMHMEPRPLNGKVTADKTTSLKSTSYPPLLHAANTRRVDGTTVAPHREFYLSAATLQQELQHWADVRWVISFLRATLLYGKLIKDNAKYLKEKTLSLPSPLESYPQFASRLPRVLGTDWWCSWAPGPGCFHLCLEPPGPDPGT